MKKNTVFLLLWPAAGFLWGIWHGALAPISFIVSLFKKNIGIYEPAKKRWPYNLGFRLAIGGSSGGTVHYRKRRR